MERRPRGCKPFVVVLTGGPSAGKSSALATLRSRLSVRGFQVLTVPENATHFLANSDGFQSEWAGKGEQVHMQRIFIDYQLHQEDAFKAFAALHPSKPAVILLDCCTINSKVYLTDEQFRQALTLPGLPELSEDQLMQRYDLVIHMVTCASSGSYEWGPCSSNPGRYHSPEQAKDCDQRCLEVFESHPQLRVVPHCESFEEKIQKVLDFVNDALHVEGLAGKRCRKTVRVTNVADLLMAASSPSTSSFFVTSTFLDDQMHHSVRRRVKVRVQSWLSRFRRWQAPSGLAAAVPVQEVALPSAPLPNSVSFERRASLLSPAEPSQRYLTRKMVHEDEYFTTIESVRQLDDLGIQAGSASRAAGRSLVAATKYVLSFVAAGHYYELFFFDSDKGRLLLDLGEEAPTPHWLEDVVAVGEEQPVVSAIAASATASAAFHVLPPTREERAAVVAVAVEAPASLASLAAATAAARPLPLPPSVRPAKRLRTLGRHTTEEAALRRPCQLAAAAAAIGVPSTPLATA